MVTNQDIYIPLTKIVDNYGLINHTPEINTDEIRINIPEVNRPALQLAGFFEHFDKERVQIIGNVEYAFFADLKRPHLTQAIDMNRNDIENEFRQILSRGW